MKNKSDVFQFVMEHAKPYAKESFFMKKFPEYYSDLNNWTFPSDFTFSQKLYHYFNNDSELKLGLCPVCGNRCKLNSFVAGYKHHCSPRCSSLDENVRNKFEKTNIEKYGASNPFQSEIIKNKIKKTFIEIYGCDHPMHCKEIVNKLQQTNFERYGHICAMHSEEIAKKVIRTNLMRYGVENGGASKKSLKKIDATKRKNHTFNTSKIEQEFKKYLEDNDINFKYQYKSELYPFNCDFYFPDYDLYFEIQGHWGHGKHPFDENNEDDLNILNIWKEKQNIRPQYKMSIKVWTENDPYKRQIAKEHNLNWVEVFSIDIEEVISSFINTISKLNN